MSGGTTEGGEEARRGQNRQRWYATLRETLLSKPAQDVAHELPGLVERIKELSADDADHLVIGVSFTPKHTCLDYSIDRVIDAGEEPRVETEKEPVSTTHRYVHFAYPPDPGFDACALRALLLAAVDEERWNTAGGESTATGIARLWENFGTVE